MRLIFTIFIFIIISVQLKAQNNNIHTSFPISVEFNQRLIQETSFNFTAIALKSKQIRDFSEIGFIHKSDTIYFDNDLHSKVGSDHFYSSLIHFDQPINSIELFTQKNIDNLEVVLVNGSGEYPDFSQRDNQFETLIVN